MQKDLEIGYDVENVDHDDAVPLSLACSLGGTAEVQSCSGYGM